MAIGTQTLTNFEYRASHLSPTTKAEATLTANQARTKAQFKALINRRARRMTRSEILTELAADTTPVVDDTPSVSWLVIVNDDHATRDDLDDWLDVDPADMSADPWAGDTDWDAITAEYPFVETYAELYEALNVEQDEAEQVAWAEAGWGDVLELNRNTVEYVENDGFIVTYGDFYRRGESRR